MKYIPGSEYEVYTETNGWVAVNPDDFTSAEAVQRYMDGFNQSHVKLKGCPPPFPTKPAHHRPRG